MEKAKSKSKATVKAALPKVPYHKKPEKMSTDAWQRALRKQFAENNTFNIDKLGGHPVFCDYQVRSKGSSNSYKVAIRSHDNTLNFCTCLDFKTNGLGTCKHIEVVLHKINQKPGLLKILKKGYNPPYSSLYLKYGNERIPMLRIGTENAEEYKKLAKEYFDKNFCINNNGINHIESFLERAHTINDSFRCYEDAMSFIINTREKNERSRLLDEKLGSNGQQSQFLNSIIKANLFPYQQEGIRFAAKAGRCLIADDMGLGKTIQAIAVAELMKKEFGITRVVVACPTSLKYQWKAEIEKFTDSKVAVIEGNIIKRGGMYREDDSFYHILSYNVVARDVDYLNKSKPDMVILDEAQRIKNWKTKVAQGVKKMDSDYAIVLTGTPLENKLEELYSIVQFVDVFRLGAMFRFLEKHQIKDEAGKVVGYKDLHKINNLLSDILIRRTKKEVLKQLPKRIDKNLFVPMTNEQMKIHADFDDTAKRLASKWRKLGFLNEKDRQRLLLSLNCMRMVCDSTYILDQKTRHDTKIDELMSILDDAFEDPGQKVVIFSQWERMTRLVAQELDARKIKYENLNGSVPSEKRKDLFENFNKNPESRVFLSTDAGGVGLNLQAASLLINLDIPWNPAVLEQRIARIYRLGQKNNVNIINMVSMGSIEHKMLDVLKFKSSLAGGILDNGEDVIFMGDSQFKQFMKSVDAIIESEPDSGAPVPMPVVAEEDTTEERNMNKKETPAKNKDIVPPTNLMDHEDLPQKQAERQKASAAATPASELLSAGMDFFGKLAKTFSDKEATENFIASITEKDKNTGKTFVKIPVEDEKMVENAVNLLSGFLKVFQK